MKILLEDIFKKLVSFLNKEKCEYLIIGGIAAGVLGEPRLTGDIDVDILLDQNNIDNFLKKLTKEGFKVNKEECLDRIKKSGTFKINFGDFHIDFIISSTTLENEAFKRKKIINLYGIKTNFPSVEDFILFKIIPARPQDLVDIEKVLLRYKDKLDTKYLLDWAQKLSDEAEDMRIWKEIQRILKE